ncbi:MAG: hypothetical protein JWP30_148 [Homoserinimonas sp.]|nr:hypothetical protein [Mycetocola sp.]MCU1545048.1 hypothetical protein [Homoserinimonas sp.]
MSDPQLPTGQPDAAEPTWPDADTDPELAPPVRSPVTAKGVAVVGARVIAGAVGVAVAFAAVTASSFLPLPSYSVTPPGVSVTPVPALQQRACAGPVLRLGGEMGEGATVVSAVGAPEVAHAASGGRVETVQFAATDESSGKAATVLTLPAPDDASHALFAGSQSQLVSAGTLAGLATANCAEAVSQAWLVGGSTATGRTTLVRLSNPGTVIATVSLSVFGELGLVDAPGTDGIVVQPGSERILSLAGLAPDLASPVVHVTSVGGRIVATLQQTTVRTLQAGGVDFVAPTQAPSRNMVIPGLVLSSHELIEHGGAIAGFEDLAPTVRFFVPGKETAHARVVVSSESGASEPVTVTLDMAAGRTSELPLQEFADGSYTVTIDSDVPVVAGARVSTMFDGGANDFAWHAATLPVRERALVAVAPGPGAAMHLHNPTETDAAVTIAPSADATKTVTVPAGGSVAVAVGAGSAYELSGFDALHVTVSYLGDGVVSNFTVTPPGPGSKPLLVYP